MTSEEIRKHFHIENSPSPVSDIRLRFQKVGDRIILDLALLMQTGPKNFIEHNSSWELSLLELETYGEVNLKDDKNSPFKKA